MCEVCGVPCVQRVVVVPVVCVSSGPQAQTERWSAFGMCAKRQA